VLTETFDIRWFLSILDGDLNGFCRKAILACPCKSKRQASPDRAQKKFTILINFDFLPLPTRRIGPSARSGKGKEPANYARRAILTVFSAQPPHGLGNTPSQKRCSNASLLENQRCPNASLFEDKSAAAKKRKDRRPCQRQ
jgi:hypothetical protein